MPHGSIQVWIDTNWNPASPVSNEASNQIVSAAVPTDDSSATILAKSGRDLGVSATSSAPMIGTTMMAVRIGKPRLEGRFLRRASEDPPDHHEPAEQQHDADADDRAVLAHVSGLALADLVGGLADDDRRAGRGAVDDRWRRTAAAPSKPRRPGLPMNQVIAVS